MIDTDTKTEYYDLCCFLAILDAKYVNRYVNTVLSIHSRVQTNKHRAEPFLINHNVLKFDKRPEVVSVSTNGYLIWTGVTWL